MMTITLSREEFHAVSENVSEIRSAAMSHPAFDESLFCTQDVEKLCDIGGDICDWTMVAIQADRIARILKKIEVK